MLDKCPQKSNIDVWLGFRENVAAQLLFSDCLKKFEKSSRHNAIYNMFGSNTVITTTKNDKVTQVPKVQKPLSQKPISSFLLDSFIVSNIKKNERASATAAKKKIKECLM